MKKLLLAALSLFVCATVLHAQEYDEKTFTITPNIYGGIAGATQGSEEGTLIGGGLNGEYFASDFYRITLSASYLNYKIKDEDGSIGLIPVLVGVRRHFSEPFYVGTRIGFTKVTKGGGTAFTYGFNIGYIIQQKVDISLDIQSASKGGEGLLLAGIRVGYRL